MSTDGITLDAAALDRLTTRVNKGDRLADNTQHALISQARAALALRADLAASEASALELVRLRREEYERELADLRDKLAEATAERDIATRYIGNLAAVQADNARLRETLLAWREADREAQEPRDDGAAFDSLRMRAIALMYAALSHAPGSDDALREFGERVAREVDRCAEHGSSESNESIVSRLLGKEGKS